MRINWFYRISNAISLPFYLNIKTDLTVLLLLFFRCFNAHKISYLITFTLFLSIYLNWFKFAINKQFINFPLLSFAACFLIQSSNYIKFQFQFMKSFELIFIIFAKKLLINWFAKALLKRLKFFANIFNLMFLGC